MIARNGRETGQDLLVASRHAKQRDLLRSTGRILKESRIRHFEIRYLMQSPFSGLGAGPEGVHFKEILSAYAEGLERAWALRHQTFGEPGWGGRLQVFILDAIVPYCAVTLAHEAPLPEITLRTSSLACDRDAALAAASLDAAHEGCHAFNHLALQRCGLPAQPWLDSWTWADEATACFMEPLCYPESVGWLPHLFEWVARPDRPMDLDPSGSSQYLRFLELRERVGFVSNLWKRITPKKNAFEQINASCQTEPPAGHLAHFGEYSAEAFFVTNPLSAFYSRAVAERYAHRAVAHTWELSGASRVKSNGKLDHLSCSYYRFRLGETVKRVSLTVITKRLGAFECFATLQPHPDLSAPVAVPLRTQTDGAAYVCTIPVSQTGPKCLLLTVANAGARGKGRSPDAQHIILNDDEIEFEIEAEASVSFDEVHPRP
jgi:hypothetical protein